MEQILIGRSEESAILGKALHSNEAEIVVLKKQVCKYGPLSNITNIYGDGWNSTLFEGSRSWEKCCPKYRPNLFLEKCLYSSLLFL